MLVRQPFRLRLNINSLVHSGDRSLSLTIPDTGVLSAGKFVSFKFKPWQAVGVAKNIGNAAQFLGSVLALVSLGMDAHAMYQEHERERKMAEARQGITSEFQSIAKDLETQIELQLLEGET